MLGEFNVYLTEQTKQPYVYGAQHLKLTPDNYEAIIHKKEDGRGKYADGTTYADAVIAFCKKQFDAGATVLYAYDCSGLGMYFIQNLHHIWSDCTADMMMSKCVDITSSDPPKMGWWVFKCDSKGKATHIGYMVDDKYLIEAKGRKYGVVRTKFSAKSWTQWGIPKCFEDDIKHPQPVPPVPPVPPVQPTPPTPPVPPVTKQYVEIIGKSVRIRKKDSVLSKTVKIAHNHAYYKAHGKDKPNDRYPFVQTAPSGWYEIELSGLDKDDIAYITSKAKYTKLIEVTE